MTREQLDAIRARFDSGLSLEYDETEALLAEVERLTAERAALQVGDTASTALEANERFAPSENMVVYIEKWCDGSGPCAVELEPHGHWRLSRSVSLASVRKAERDAAFSRGVAAMREAAVAEHDAKERYDAQADERKAIWRAYAERQLSEDEAKARLAALEGK